MRRMSNFAGANIDMSQISAHANIKEALKEAELQKTIKAMEEQLAKEDQKNQ